MTLEEAESPWPRKSLDACHREEALQKFIATHPTLRSYTRSRVELDAMTRWSANTAHHAFSETIVSHLKLLDRANGSILALEEDGDGDNATLLLYLLDMFFEWVDTQEMPHESNTPTLDGPEGSLSDPPQDEQAV